MGAQSSKKKREEIERKRREGVTEMKVVLVGDGFVGKSSMFVTFYTQNFPIGFFFCVFVLLVGQILSLFFFLPSSSLEYLPTVCENSYTHHIVDDRKINLGLWGW